MQKSASHRQPESYDRSVDEARAAGEVREATVPYDALAGLDALTAFADQVASQIKQRLLTSQRLLARNLNAEQLAERMLAVLPDVSPWDGELGPFYSTGRVRGLLGDISRQAVMDRMKRGTLLGLQTADGKRVYPLFQLDSKNRVLAGLPPVWQALRASEADEWTLASWLVSPLSELGGSSAIDWLRNGGDPQEILSLARGAAERFAQ